MGKTLLALVLASLSSFVVSAQDPPEAPAIVARVVYASGDVSLADDGTTRAIKSNMVVREGQMIATHGNAVVYLRTEDGGFFILRENSKGIFHRYRLHPNDPKKQEFKLELIDGVGRVVTGAGARESRDRFRFNTPVAAIGVRGTDFSVFTSQTVTRALINSGEIAFTPIGDNCQAKGIGPCTSDRTIFLKTAGTQAAEVDLIELRPRPIAVDRDLQEKLSPRSGEPMARSKSESMSRPPSESGGVTLSTTGISEFKLLEASQNLQPDPLPNLRWGRWQALANLPATIDERELAALGYRAAAFDTYHIVMRHSGVPINSPLEGQIGFALKGHEGAVVNLTTGTARNTQVQSGSLLVDFGKKTFQTNLTVTGENLPATQLSSRGSLSSSATFSSGVLEKTTVRGAVAGNSANEAAYFYRHQINPSTQLTGTTFWRR